MNEWNQYRIAATIAGTRLSRIAGQNGCGFVLEPAALGIRGQVKSEGTVRAQVWTCRWPRAMQRPARGDR